MIHPFSLSAYCGRTSWLVNRADDLLLRSVLSAIVATHKRYDAERKVSDRLVAELSAIAEDMKQAREARERSETRRSAPDSTAAQGRAGVPFG